MKVEVFTDGACTKNGQKNAHASWAFYFPEHKSISKAGAVSSDEAQTNQRGELRGILEAIKAAEVAFSAPETDLKIYTDSMYAKNCLTTWLEKWIQTNWKTTQGNDVIHRDLIEEAAGRMKTFKSVGITHVKAHTGKDDYESQNNHIVDRMASEIVKPTEHTKVISNKESPIKDLPLQLMGEPMEETKLVAWCLANLESIDSSALASALISALGKTVKKKGFEIEKQRLHRTNLYRLKTDTGIIKEVVITKE